MQPLRMLFNFISQKVKLCYVKNLLFVTFFNCIHTTLLASNRRADTNANSGRSDFPFQWVWKNTEGTRWRLPDRERRVFSRRP